MRIGIGVGAIGQAAGGLRAVIEQIERAERDGFASVWLPNISGYDALITFALAGQETERIELGTFVVSTYPRHPVALAQQALTVQAATGNRLALGIGLSHRIVIEDAYGLDYSRPIPHMREYLTVLTSLLTGKPVDFQGEQYRVAVQVSVPEAARPPVVVAALGPVMLRLAGRLADGTATWMGGLTYLRDVAVPTITEAARKAGRPAPRIVAGLPVCVTSDPAAARETAGRMFARYGQLPSYRATLDRGGAAGPEEVAIVGDEAEVERQLRAFADAGVTDFNAAIYQAPGGSTERTYEALAALAQGVGSRQ